jgi:hypothetical protein
MKLYIFDFGLILENNEKINFFTLQDKKSLDSRIDKILAFDKTSLEVDVLSKDFVENFVRDRATKMLISELRDEYKKKSHSFKDISDPSEILDVCERVPFSQAKNFMVWEIANNKGGDKCSNTRADIA